ncbi:Uncharacterised protein [uncultured archaeon]|nr:Uncharacterised protein [uncultured archaeon]
MWTSLPWQKSSGRGSWAASWARPTSSPRTRSGWQCNLRLKAGSICSWRPGGASTSHIKSVLPPRHRRSSPPCSAIASPVARSWTSSSTTSTAFWRSLWSAQALAAFSSWSSSRKGVWCCWMNLVRSSACSGRWSFGAERWLQEKSTSTTPVSSIPGRSPRMSSPAGLPLRVRIW